MKISPIWPVGVVFSLAALFWAAVAIAQVPGGGINPVPPITPNDCAKWVTPYSLGDNGATCASGAPSGPAGGDLGGTYPNPSVQKYQGQSLLLGAFSATVSAPGGAASHSYAPADTITLAGGTSTQAAILTLTDTQASNIAAWTIAVPGTNCTNGAGKILTGTTGTGTPFQVSATASGNAIVSIQSISVAGDYTVNPTDLTAEPVTGDGCTGTELSIVIGAEAAFISNNGSYTTPPTNPASQSASSGSGTGATWTMNWGSGTAPVNPSVQYDLPNFSNTTGAMADSGLAVGELNGAGGAKSLPHHQPGLDFDILISNYAENGSVDIDSAGDIQFAPASGAVVQFNNIPDTVAGDQSYCVTSGIYLTTGYYCGEPGAPLVASGFGTGAAVVHYVSAAAFSIDVGTSTISTSGVLTLPTAPHGWSCHAEDDTTTTITVGASSNSATAVTLTTYSRTTGTATAATASDILTVQCGAF